MSWRMFQNLRDLTDQLPRDLYYQVVHTLLAALPPPVSERAEDLEHRDHAAIACMAAMLPANGEEASVAAQCVAANAQALEWLRQARQHADDIAIALRCSAQAAAMMRQMRGARTLLMRMQREREKCEANAARLGQAELIEHCATGLMAQALGIHPPGALEEPPVAAPPPPPEPPDDDEEPVMDLAAEADRYAIIYPQRAVLIRRLGGLPEKCDFGPPSPELVRAIVSGDSPTLNAL